MKKICLLLIFGVLMTIKAAVALAQAAVPPPSSTDVHGDAAPELESITVTARRTEESLQRVPVSVVAITKQQLENNDATDLTKLAELAPQVIIGEPATGTGALLSIRGISSSSADSGLDQSVLVAIDGVPMSRGRVVTLSTFDMQQVEIMEGPQALFFGKNSPAGVISLTSADPTDKFEGYAKTGYEFVGREEFVEGAVSGKVADHLDARLAVRADYMDGYTTNTATAVDDPFHAGVVDPGAISGHREPGGKDLAARLTVLWAPVDEFEAKLKFTVDQQDLDSATAYSEPYCTGDTPPTVLGVPSPGTDCEKNRHVAISGLASEFAANYPYGNEGKPYQTSLFNLTSLTLNEKLDDVTLTSTSGLYDQSISDAASYDWSPFTTVYDAEHEHYRLFTQELRANTTMPWPVNFMGGLYFEHSTRSWFNAPDLFNGGVNPAVDNYSTVQGIAKTLSTSYSAFVQVRWNITDELELSGGARYTHDSKDIAAQNSADNPAAALLGIALYPQGDVLRAHYSGDNTSPEATLSWHPEPDQTLYVAWKNGYKAGGLSNSAFLAASASAQNLVFGHESSRGEEIGYKADLFNHTVRLDLTGYYYNYNGLQVSSYNAETLSFLIGNAARARTEGVEATAQWLANRNLTFNGSFGYNRARYLKFPGAACFVDQTAAQGCVAGVQDLTGHALLDAPNLTFDLGGDYRVKFPQGWNADLGVDGSHSSSYETDSDYNPGTVQPAFWRLNASIRISPESGNYDVSLIGRDLTNSYYLTSSFGQTGGGPNQFIGYFNRPREVLLQATYKF